MVKNLPVGHYDSPVTRSLVKRVVAMAISLIIRRASPQDGEFLVEVPTYEWEERERWEEDLGDEGCYDCCEGGCDAMSRDVRRGGRAKRGVVFIEGCEGKEGMRSRE